MIFVATWPWRNRIIVGIDMTWYWAAVCWLSSTLSFTTRRSSRSSLISSSTGATMRHGPHQGAQKSTSTGVSDSRTSAWKLSSVTWVMVPAMRVPPGRVGVASRSIVPPAGPAKRGHEPGGLQRDPPRHLRAALAALPEDDRDLLHAQPRADGAPRQLELERVALRADACVVDRLE